MEWSLKPSFKQNKVTSASWDPLSYYVVIFSRNVFSSEKCRIKITGVTICSQHFQFIRSGMPTCYRATRSRLFTKTPTQTCIPPPCTPGTSWRCGVRGVVLDGGRSAEPADQIRKIIVQLGWTNSLPPEIGNKYKWPKLFIFHQQ